MSKNYWEDYQQIYNHGLELCESGHLTAALVNFERAIELQPEFALAWSAKGNALLKLGRTAEADVYFKRATDLQALTPTTHLPSPASQRSNQSKQSDGVVTSTPVHTSPAYAALCSQAVGLYDTERLDEALMTFDQAIAIHPHSPEALRGKGRVLASLGRTADAQATFADAAKLEAAETGKAGRQHK